MLFLREMELDGEKFVLVADIQWNNSKHLLFSHQEREKNTKDAFIGEDWKCKIQIENCY